MDTLRESFKLVKDRLTGFWRAHKRLRADDTGAAEQTEQEEQVDILIDPLRGINVIRHPVGRHPRRA